MVKKILGTFAAIFLIIPLAGCWNYVGLDELSIITGVAIDRDLTGENYEMTFEIIDFAASSTDTGMLSNTVQSKGKTLAEATRNAKGKLSNRLYWGNAYVVVISEKVAKEQGLAAVIDLLLRVVEPRENLDIVISKERTAADILTAKGTDEPIIAHLMQNIVNEDVELNGSTERIELFQIYNILLGHKQSLVLPAFQKRSETDKEVIEVDGIAIFKNDKLIGYLSPEQTKYYLFATDKIVQGVLPVDAVLPDIPEISFDIEENKTDFSYEYKNNKLKVTLNIDTSLALIELMGGRGQIDQQFLEELEDITERKLKEKITDVIKLVQTHYNSDIFGFGMKIYQKDPKLWKKLEKEWSDKTFQNLEVDVKTKITIVNTGLIKDK